MSLNQSFGTLDTKTFLEKGKMYWFLFIEGMGTYGEVKINQKSLTDYQSYVYDEREKYIGFTEEDMKVLANEFLKIQDDIFFLTQEKNEKWFGGFKDEINGKKYDLNSLVYVIGARVIDDLINRKNFTFEKLVKYELSDEKLQNEIADSLKYLSDN